MSAKIQPIMLIIHNYSSTPSKKCWTIRAETHADGQDQRFDLTPYLQGESLDSGTYEEAERIAVELEKRLRDDGYTDIRPTHRQERR